MQTTREPALTQHPGYIALAMQEFTGLGIIATKIKGSYDRCAHNFGIAHYTLLVFLMMKPFQHIVNKTKNGYNLGVHEFSFLSDRFCHPSTLAENSWIF
jgi:hypothetical protein